jgi:hypothetical protein
MTIITIKLPADAQQTYDLENRQMNTVSIEVPAYSHSGVLSIWEEMYTLSADIYKGHTITIRADKGGLLSLARHLLTLAQDDYPIGSHIHYDAGTSLEDDSYPLIIDKISEQDVAQSEDSSAKS